jgi:hypothetical protein
MTATTEERLDELLAMSREVGRLAGRRAPSLRVGSRTEGEDTRKEYAAAVAETTRKRALFLHGTSCGTAGGRSGWSNGQVRMFAKRLAGKYQASWFVLAPEIREALVSECVLLIVLVDVPDEETALLSAYPTIMQLIDQGRCRCVPHARLLEPGKFYRRGAVVRLPRDPQAEEISRYDAAEGSRLVLRLNLRKINQLIREAWNRGQKEALRGAGKSSCYSWSCQVARDFFPNIDSMDVARSAKGQARLHRDAEKREVVIVPTSPADATEETP